MYPREMVLACKSHKNGIFRKERAANGLLDAENVKLTLLETEEPQMFETYDSFDVPEFTFSEQSGTGSFKIQLSLQKKWKDLAIGAQIVDMEKETVIMDIPLVTEKNQSQLSVSKEFHLDSNQTATTIGIIAMGKWGNKELEENEVSVYREANTAAKEFTYVHVYPKPEEETVRMGKIEHDTGKTGKVTKKDHIVIALIREPNDLTDVDYLCGAGRYGGANHPVLCVPGEGYIQFPADHKAESDSSHQNTAICKLFRKQGGAAVIATTEAYEIDNCISIAPMGNKYHYSFRAWNKDGHGTPYDDPDGWQKTEFDYHLELKLYSTTQEGGEKKWHKHRVVVCSDGVSEVEMTSLQIMYGCVAPETMIKMEDGKEKEIRSIRIGDIVIGKDNVRMEVVNVWKGPEMEAMVEITTEDGKNKVLATKTHPIWVKTDGGTLAWKRAKDCCMGDMLLIERKGYCPIGAITQKSACETVYNLDLKPLDDAEGSEGSMYCNGILTGDNRMQNGIKGGA